MNPPTIMVVDDDEHFARITERALTAFGYSVVPARNGVEALKLYHADTIQLVLTDLIMPDMEGVELIVTLRRLNPSVKVIAMSGGGRNNPAAYLPIAQRVGAMKTLAKPFSLEELRQTVADCLASP